MSEVQDHPMVGCLVDGHWGQYADARVVLIAADYGFEDEHGIELANWHLAAMGPGGWEPLEGDQFERLLSASEDAEAWLNANVAQEGHTFRWDDGEFFYQVDEDDDRVEDPWH